MTTEVIVRAMCGSDKEVRINFNNGEEITLQDGEESNANYVYDDREVSGVKEVLKVVKAGPDDIPENEGKLPSFREDLTSLLNKHCKENRSNTPDFILAEYLDNCLSVYDRACVNNSKWHNGDQNDAPETSEDADEGTPG